MKPSHRLLDSLIVLFMWMMWICILYGIIVSYAYIWLLSAFIVATLILIAITAIVLQEKPIKPKRER